MNRPTFAYVCLFVLLLMSTIVSARTAPPRPAVPDPAGFDLDDGGGTLLHGGGVTTAKTPPDTFVLMGPGGSGAPFRGDFEDAEGQPHWNGWTSVDLTESSGIHWHASTYHAVNGGMSAWCGDLSYPSCEAGDPDGGYGNDWDDWLEWRQVVDDPSLGTQLTVSAMANIDSEPGYDYVSLRVEKAGQGFVELAAWDGRYDALSIVEAVSYLPGEYLGAGGDEVVVIWRFESDFTWSDEDCSYPSGGAVQLDDVVITSDNGAGTGGVVDFEDGTLGPFQPLVGASVGDFAQLWTNLEDADPCRTNYTPQVAFIDDGLVVPGVGPTLCQTWCYGPNGYIVNNTGGLAGPDKHLHNAVRSSVMAWPVPSHRGARLDFDVYRHEPLSFNTAGVFYLWHVRSTATPGGGDIGVQPWRNRNRVDFGGPEYFRHMEVLDDLLEDDVRAIQIQLLVWELGHIWGWDGPDGTPAPYFDNVRVMTYPVIGPSLVARSVELAADAFPAAGTIDPADPGAAGVRFDMARNINRFPDLEPAFGDSMVFNCTVTRPGAVLEGPPYLHYKVQKNPEFDPYRTDPTPYAGSVACLPVIVSGSVVEDRYWGDLPDEDWLYPGDVVHYYLRATDRDTTDGSLESAILPADTTGFSEFGLPRYGDDYDRHFTVRALPSVHRLDSPWGVTHPNLLVWLKEGSDEQWERWREVLIRDMCFTPGWDIDIFRTQASLDESGLGAHATADLLAGYRAVVVSTGQRGGLGSAVTIEESPDVQVLTAYLAQEDHGLILTGHHLARDLRYGSPAALDFLGDQLGLQYVSDNLAPLVGGQTTPWVATEPPFDVFDNIHQWVQGEDCLAGVPSDAVRELSAERLARFTAPGGSGSYEYVAASRQWDAGLNSGTLYLPYDLGWIVDAGSPGPSGPVSGTRGLILFDLLGACGVATPECIIGVPDAVPAAFTAGVGPNPFNPLTRISWTAPRAGRLQLKIYDLRGRLVATLRDEPVGAGAGFVDWDGTDARGAQVASGVYFYEVRLHGEVRTGKMALIR